MPKTKAQIIAEAQVVKNATEVGENTATRVGGVLEDLADADSVVIIPVTGTSSGGNITLSSNPFTQVQTAVNAGQHAIVRVTIGNDVVDFSMNTYSDSVSTYIGASKFLLHEFQMRCSASGTVIESINTSNTFSTGENVPNVGIDAVPTQGSNNLVKSGGVYSEVSQLGQQVIYDVSANNDEATFASLSALLSSENLSTLIPIAVRCGGMSIRFVQSSDNKYVQYRLVSPTWSTDIHDWTSEDPYFIDKIMQEVNEAIDENTPIEIIGDVTNAPDEEDLTSVNVGGTDVLKFKDKAYNPLTYSGLGRKILRKNIVNGVNTLTLEMMSDANTIYVIQYDFILGENITVPANCVLEFDGGSVSGEHTLTGQNTIIDYKNPFVGNSCMIIGCTTFSDMNTDSGIFKTVEHTQREIEILFSLSRKGVKTIFSKGVYNNISEISITKELDADFGNSVIHVADYGDKVNKNLFNMVYADEAEIFTLESFCLKNVEIVGSGDNYYTVEYIDEQGNKPQYSHPYTPCIQLFNVRNIVFDNVDINNYIIGAKGSLDIDYRMRWNNHLVSCYWYETCSIQNCKLSWCVSEGYMLVPKTIESNISTITDCYSHDYYYTLFYVSDGKIVFQRNTIDRGACTMAHLHGYDAEVSFNTFKNGSNNTHTCIRLEENGSYYATNFNIHNNYFKGNYSAICLSGSDIYIHDNVYNGTKCFVETRGYDSSLESAPNSQDRIPVDSRNKNLKIERNVINGQWLLIGVNIDNISIVNNKSTILDVTVRGMQIECGNCSNIEIISNIFTNTARNKMSAILCYINLDNTINSGDVIIKSNYFYGNANIIIGGTFVQGQNLLYDRMFITNNFSENNVSVFASLNILEIGELYFKDNKGIKYKGITSKTLYSLDIQELADTTNMLSGIYVKKYQFAYVGDTKYTCTKEGIYAIARPSNKFCSRGQLFTTSDGSIAVCINEGKTSSTEPDYTSVAVGETITDGGLTVKRLTTESAIFATE